jgi:hypothetical protein
VSAWLPDDVAQLRALRAGGLSYGKIGKRLDRSKCACVSKWHRLAGHYPPNRRREPRQGAKVFETYAVFKARKRAERAALRPTCSGPTERTHPEG